MKIAYQVCVVANEQMDATQFEHEVLKRFSIYGENVKIHSGKRINQLGADRDLHMPAANEAIANGHFGYVLHWAPSRLVYEVVVCIESDDKNYIDKLNKSLTFYPNRYLRKLYRNEYNALAVDCESVD
jgi:hypothetical protein